MLTRSRCLFIVVFLNVFTCFSQDLIQNKEASKITFTIKNLGFNVDGSFNKFTIASNLNSEQVKPYFLNAEIVVQSIFTDSESRDEHLLAADYFNASTYPKIIFKSTEIKKVTATKFILRGLITIKGIQKKVETPIEIKEDNGKISVVADFELNRKDFDVGGSSFILSKTVTIKMDYVARRN